MSAASAAEAEARGADVIAVRPLERRDEDEWRTLWRAYLAFYATDLPDEVYRASFERMIDPTVPERQGLVAERDGAIVGIAHYIFHAHGWRLEPVTYLQDLYVAEAARGTGAGRALMEAVYREADAAGAPAVYWLTQIDNAPARRLYDRLGRVTDFIRYVR